MDSPGAVRLYSTLPLEWSAGYEYVLVAVGVLRDRGIDVDARFPDEGADRERVLFTIHDLGLLDVVRLGSGAPESARPDVRLLTPLRDHIVPPEVTATPGPVVATDLPMLRERVGSHPDARLVPVRDPHAIAAAVADLVGREIR